MMARRLANALAVALVLATSCAGHATAAERITWSVPDFPPFQILDGPAKGTGSFDGLLSLLIARLPQYEHDIVPMTFARREAEAKQGTDLCTPGIFRTPARESYMAFSTPALLHLDNRLVFRAERAPRFVEGDAVDLEKVLQSKDLVGGIAAGRSYAPNIDALIARYSGHPNVVVRPWKAEQFFQMLLANEVDYIILFPHEANFLAQRFDARDRIGIRAIAGTPPTIATAVSCTRTALGQRIIGDVDTVIAEAIHQPEYRALSERWYEDRDKQLIRRYHDQMLGSR
jgi:uncharacterized protein (TIGR02285 family)